MAPVVVVYRYGELFGLRWRGCCRPEDVASREVVCAASVFSSEVGALLCDVEGCVLELVYLVEVDIFGLGAVFFILCGTGLVFGSGGGLTGCILWCRDPVVVCRPDPRI